MVEVHSIAGGNDEALRTLRHSTSHVMAAAVGRLFPDVKFAIGPAVEDGFYYDFDVEKPFVPEDLEQIETRMHKIIEADLLQALQR